MAHVSMVSPVIRFDDSLLECAIVCVIDTTVDLSVLIYTEYRNIASLQAIVIESGVELVMVCL